jgi:pimeloyl-ACP methyl ester carboxylesterase
MRTLLALLVLGATSVAQAQGKDVDIKAADGTNLKATYYSPGKPGPGVILLHICNSNRKVWSGLAPILTARGMHVLALDYRGYGDSGGKPQATLTPEERLKVNRDLWPGDFDRAFDFLVAQPGVDKAKIGASGGSCGVNNAIHLARRHPEQVTTLVLLAGGTDQAGQQFLASAPWIPIFGVAANDDGDAPEVLKWVIGFSSNRENRVKVYDKGGHGTELFPVYKELEPRIAAWFEKHLVKTPVKPGGAAKPGPSAQLATLVATPEGIAKLRAEVKRGGKNKLPPEGALNLLGYGHLQAGRTQEAIDLFTLNVEAHPGSANVYDSLADAYAAAGDHAKAAEYAKKAIAALDKDKGIGEEMKQAIRKSAEGKLQPPPAK